MNNIFTQQLDIVAAGTDLVISLTAAGFAAAVTVRHIKKSRIRRMCLLMFAAEGGRAFSPVYVYAAVCIAFAAGSGIYCIAEGKAG